MGWLHCRRSAFDLLYKVDLSTGRFIGRSKSRFVDASNYPPIHLLLHPVIGLSNNRFIEISGLMHHQSLYRIIDILIYPEPNFSILANVFCLSEIKESQ